jgi:opacity protein-like surface antigen
MNRFILTAAAVVTMCSTAAAADLLVTDVPAEVPAPEASSINGYVQLMGGWTMPNTMDYSAESQQQIDGSYDFDAGWALGATLGIETPIDGVSVEVDVLRTWADAAGEGDLGAGSLISTSLMANAVYSVDLNDMFSLYGGAGLGIIALEAVGDEESFGVDASGSGAGYQVFAGIQAAVAENVALTFEARYQSAIDDIEMTPELPIGQGQQEFNRTSILAGVLFSF